MLLLLGIYFIDFSFVVVGCVVVMWLCMFLLVGFVGGFVDFDVDLISVVVKVGWFLEEVCSEGGVGFIVGDLLWGVYGISLEMGCFVLFWGCLCCLLGMIGFFWMLLLCLFGVFLESMGMEGNYWCSGFFILGVSLSFLM